MKQILLVDDHPLTREGYKAVIEGLAGFEVVGEAGNAADGIRLFSSLHPDLTIMDISLPDATGIELTRWIRLSDPAARVLIVSIQEKIDYITDALSAGASGYVLKGSPIEVFVDGLRIVSGGDFFLDSSLSQELVHGLIQCRENPGLDEPSRYGGLTAREREVLRLVVEGLATRAIADRLHISEKTVRNHRNNIMSKLNLHTLLDLVRYAARTGIIDIDAWKI